MLTKLSSSAYLFIQDITDMIFGKPEPDSNEALRRWLNAGNTL